MAQDLEPTDAFRVSEAVRRRVLDALPPGRSVAQLLDDRFGHELPALAPLGVRPALGGGEKRFYRLDGSGIVVLEVTGEGTLAAAWVESGDAARALADDLGYDGRWRALAAPEPLQARSWGEILLYLRVQGAQVLSHRVRTQVGRALVEVLVERDGGDRRYAFQAREIDRTDELHLGGGNASWILDPADFLLFASDVERELPGTPAPDPVERRRVHHDLQLAAEAVDEVQKFIPRGSDRVPRDVLRTIAARWLYDKEPERFGRDQLRATADRLRQAAVEWVP